MLLQFSWRSRQAHSPAELRRAGFHALLVAAFRTRYYRPILETVSQRTGKDVAALGSVEEVLALLPRTESSRVRRDPKAFRNWDEPEPSRQKLFHPLPLPSRTAVLMRGFQKNGRVKVFDELSRRELARFRPDSIAGPVDVLRRLAEAAEDRGAWVPRLTHSVIAFHTPLRAFLSDEARELFWRVFQVPVFGQFLGLGGELLAWECEAHDGLHIRRENAVFELDNSEGEPELLLTSLVNLRQPVLRFATGLTASIERCPCGCGHAGPRLTGVRRRSLGAATIKASAAGVGSCAAD